MGKDILEDTGTQPDRAAGARRAPGSFPLTARHERWTGRRALLRFLQQQGRLSAADAARLEQVAQQDGLSIQELLERQGTMPEADLAALLASTLRLRLIDLTSFPPDPGATRVLKEKVATEYEVIPVRVDEGTIEVATANPLDLEALKAVEFATGRRVQTVVATRAAVRDALAHAYRLQESLEEFLRGVPDEEPLAPTELNDDGADLRTIAHDAELPPLVRIADLVLIEAIKSGASDVHIAPTPDGVGVRYRIDGLLEEVFHFPKWVQNALLGRFKVMSKLDISERRIPQDGRLQVRYQGRLVDFRVSSLPTQHGEKITIRVLDAGRVVWDLERLGFSGEELSRMREAVRRPEGMILVTGPTGSGKTTTLYAFIREVFSPSLSIVTIEDPIEYQLAGVSQVEINEKQRLTFASVLRSVLRQDPDVILVGEIRDQETARIALQAAQTGHLVFSTVHTKDSAATVSRLLDLGIEPYVLASALNLVVAQRLVRRVCPTCSVPYESTPGDPRIERLVPDLGACRRGQGCPACRRSGYAGRTGIYEVLTVSPTIAKLIETRAGESAIRRQARAEGCNTLLDDATAKLRAGVTSPDEVLRVVQVNDHAPQCPGCRREIADDYASCPHCSHVLRRLCDGCTRPLGAEWVSCPYCSTEQPGAPSASLPATSAQGGVGRVEATAEAGANQHTRGEPMLTRRKLARRNARRSEAGVALAVAIFVIAALMLAATSAIQMASADLLATRNYRGAAQAHFVAESGIAEALQAANGPGVIDFGNDVVAGWSTLYGGASRTFAPLVGFTYTVTPFTSAADPVNRGGFLATASGPEGTTNSVVATVLRAATPLTAPAAVYLATDAPTDSTFKGNALAIDGNDHNYDGSAGSAPPVPGIATRQDANTQEVLAGLDKQQQDNVQGLGYSNGPPIAPSVMTSPAAPSVDQLEHFIRALLARPGVVTDPPSNGNPPPFGTTASPQITHFTGSELKLNGTASGAGILIVDGALTINGTFDFKGLILVRGRTTITGNATVYGSIWTENVDLTVGGSAIVAYSRQALQVANLAGGGTPLPGPLLVTSLADCAELPAATGGCP